MPPKDIKASAPRILGSTHHQDPPRNGNARNDRMPQCSEQRRRKFEVINGTKKKPTPPTTPAGAVWVPRNDREAICSAFQHHGVSIALLSMRQRRKYKVIESVLRDRMDEQDGRIRAIEATARLHIARRAA